MKMTQGDKNANILKNVNTMSIELRQKHVTVANLANSVSNPKHMKTMKNYEK